MKNKLTVPFSTARTDYYFNASALELDKLVSREKTVLVTDEHLFTQHQVLFGDWNTIVLKPGEEYKVQDTVDALIGPLLEFEADRDWWLVGVGGGVVTDITGSAAGIYQRGLRFGFIPTSILAMVDASASGARMGSISGCTRTMAGLIRQPATFCSMIPASLRIAAKGSGMDQRDG